MLLWMSDWFGRLMKLFQHMPSTRSFALALVALIVLFVVVRLVIAASARDDRAERGTRRRSVVLDDQWGAADTLAAQERYEEAAHALYRAIVLSLGRLERLRLDPAKTSGDYARELRRLGAATLTPFRAFTRRFDVVVYGHARADAAAYTELRELSAPFRALVRAA